MQLIRVNINSKYDARWGRVIQEMALTNDKQPIRANVNGEYNAKWGRFPPLLRLNIIQKQKNWSSLWSTVANSIRDEYGVMGLTKWQCTLQVCLRVKRRKLRFGITLQWKEQISIEQVYWYIFLNQYLGRCNFIN